MASTVAPLVFIFHQIDKFDRKKTGVKRWFSVRKVSAEKRKSKQVVSKGRIFVGYGKMWLKRGVCYGQAVSRIRGEVRHCLFGHVLSITVTEETVYLP